MGERVPPELDPKDERLLEEDYSDKTDVKRSMRCSATVLVGYITRQQFDIINHQFHFRHAKNLSWMRRPDYISTEQTRFQVGAIEDCLHAWI